MQVLIAYVIRYHLKIWRNDEDALIELAVPLRRIEVQSSDALF